MSAWNPSTVPVSQLPEEYRELWTKYGLDNPETAAAGFLELQRAAIISSLCHSNPSSWVNSITSEENWEALNLFKLHSDHPIALRNLGTIYREGTGVTQDFKKALSYFEEAANLGDLLSITWGLGISTV